MKQFLDLIATWVAGTHPNVRSWLMTGIVCDAVILLNWYVIKTWLW